MRKIPFILLLTAGLILIFVTLDSPWSPFREGEKSVELNEKIDSIEVDVSSVSTTIIPDTRNDVEAKLKGKGKVLVEKRGNRIEIKVNRKWFEGFRLFSKSELTIYIPEDYHKDLKIDIGSGNFNFSGSQMELENLLVDVSSGNVSLKNLTVQHFKQDVSSGNVDIELLTTETGVIDLSSGKVNLRKYSGKLNAEVSSGRLDVEIDKLIDSVNLDVSSGSINLDLPNEADFTLKGKMKSGSISNNHPLTLQVADKNLIEGTYGSGKHHINLNVTSGKIDIK